MVDGVIQEDDETVASTLYWDAKYSHVVEKRPPLRLSSSFRVDENDDLLHIFQSGSHKSTKSIYCTNSENSSREDCLFENNAIENSHQIEGNIIYNVRGAGVYIEDENKMYNNIKYNVVICPFRPDDTILHGCIIPGTSNVIVDTSDNQSGFFALAATNDLTFFKLFLTKWVHTWK